MFNNAIQILDKSHIPYRLGCYPKTVRSALEAVIYIDLPIDQLFKSLLAVGKEGRYQLCLIPSSKRLNMTYSDEKLKLVDKSVVKKVTGFEMGVVTPIGLSSGILVDLDISALQFKEIGVGSGEMGKEIIISPKDLIKVTNAEVRSLVL